MAIRHTLYSAYISRPRLVVASVTRSLRVEFTQMAPLGKANNGGTLSEDTRKFGAAGEQSSMYVSQWVWWPSKP